MDAPLPSRRPFPPRLARSAAAGALVAALLPGLLRAQAAPPPSDPVDAARAAGLAPVSLARIDSVFDDVNRSDGPGCAVGVGIGGEIVAERAYGMANLEHHVANTPSTVFEPGSVSKQFTAAATLLLALDGAIDLDADVREYVPELPAYETPVTVRTLLHHTSGLRDWGSVAGIEGWPRTRRAHTHEHVLEILSRQRELNYPAGAYWSYTNSGYNLQAIIVERVAGMSFADFSMARIFQPLGMTRTEWRDDFNEIVPGRATAYRPDDDQPDGWSQLMPFEDVHGNGGLLTTVGDLLRFTHELHTGAVLGRAWADAMHVEGLLNDGAPTGYAGGLFVGEWRGIDQVQHSGSTAGYRGQLTRFPEHGLALAVMCNAADGNAGGHLYELAELYLAEHVADEAPSPPSGRVALTVAELEARAGLYRDTRTGAPLTVQAGEGVLRLRGTPMYPVSERRFVAAGGQVSLTFDDAPFAPEGRAGGGEGKGPPGAGSPVGSRAAAVWDRPRDPEVRIEPVAALDAAPGGLADYVGAYHSPDADVAYRVRVEDGGLALVDALGTVVPLRPRYPDTFTRGGLTVSFRRNAGGAVVGFTWSQGRVWGLAFGRTDGSGGAARRVPEPPGPK
jgi:CubicO group peptidase (beta-lactamase class C family)